MYVCRRLFSIETYFAKGQASTNPQILTNIRVGIKIVVNSSKVKSCEKLNIFEIAISSNKASEAPVGIPIANKGTSPVKTLALLAVSALTKEL